MPKVGDVYGGNYLNAAMVRKDKIVGMTLTIKDIRIDTFRGDLNKLVLKFDEMDKELVLNKTNAQLISESFGDDYDTWKARQIMLQVIKVPFGGTRVDAITVIPIES